MAIISNNLIKLSYCFSVPHLHYLHRPLHVGLLIRCISCHLVYIHFDAFVGAKDANAKVLARALKTPEQSFIKFSGPASQVNNGASPPEYIIIGRLICEQGLLLMPINS